MFKTALMILAIAAAAPAQAVTCEDMARVATFIKDSHDAGRSINRVKNLVSQERVGPYTRQTYVAMVDTVYTSKGWPQNYGEATLLACQQVAVR